MWNEDETTLVPLRDGNLIVASMVGNLLHELTQRPLKFFTYRREK